MATIGGVPQSYIAKLDSAGIVDVGFDPVVDGNVLDLELHDDRLFMSANFTTLHGVALERIASLDLVAGSSMCGHQPLRSRSTTCQCTRTARFCIRLAPRRWEPVATLSQRGTQRQVQWFGAGLTRGSLPLTRSAVNWTTGTRAPTASGGRSLSLGASGLLVGGDFTTVGGQVQPHFAVFDGPSVGNNSATPDFTTSCVGTTCSFDASASSDSDGWVVSYTWSFGDGQTATAVSASEPHPCWGRRARRGIGWYRDPEHHGLVDRRHAPTRCDRKGLVSSPLAKLAVTPICVATLDVDDTIDLEWTDMRRATSYVKRRNGSYLVTANNVVTYTDNPGPGTSDSLIREQPMV